MSRSRDEEKKAMAQSLAQREFYSRRKTNRRLKNEEMEDELQAFLRGEDEYNFNDEAES